ncbi:lipopolysaccharide biosynthesis protein [Pseudomonas zhanjiangensis]|uniref:Lipopolysaccharide biosynthesis protein n=1 Tax=Pseudomonas zhanjiangensis TaxID=3239015 RepID=A0ABV3YS57_9PSED
MDSNSLLFRAAVKIGHWRQRLWYVPVLASAMGLMMLRPLLMARLLDVQGFAQYSAGLLVSSSFCMLGCLGLQALLQREMPVQLVRRRELAAAMLLMQCLIVALVCASVGVLLSASGVHFAGMSHGLLALSVLHGLSQQVFLLATVESRSRGQPLHFAKQNFQRAGLVLLAGVAAARWFDAAAPVLLAETVFSLLISWRILWNAWQRLRMGLPALVRLAVRRLGRLSWSSALALLGVMVVGFSLINMDRWIAASLLPASDFAQYAFAWILLLIAQSTQSLINASVYPALARRFARDGQAASFRFATQIGSLLLLGGAVLAWPAWWLARAAVERWFPDYLVGADLLKIFLLVAILRVADFWSSHLIIIGQERRLLIINLLVAVLVGAVWLVFVEPWTPGWLSLNNLAALAVSFAAANYLAVFITAYSSGR